MTAAVNHVIVICVFSFLGSEVRPDRNALRDGVQVLFVGIVAIHDQSSVS